MEQSEGHDDGSKSSPHKRTDSYKFLPPYVSKSNGLSEEPSNQSSAAESGLGRAEDLDPHQGDDESNTTVSGFDSPPEALRIALVGKSGCGKSATGNTILGENRFYAKLSGKSVTQRCSKAESEVDGRRVAVVDTPGLFDTSLSNEEIIREASKSISLLAPGPHAFLLLVQIGRFTAEEKSAVEYIKTAFGKNAEKYIMIVFTHGDKLEEGDLSIEEYLKDCNNDLIRLISEHGNRFHVFNNKRTEDRTQVKELLEKINNRVRENGGSFYTSEMFQEAEEAIQREMDRIMKEKEEEIRRETEKIERKYQLEMEKMLMEKRRQEEEKKQMEKQLRAKEEQIKKEQDLREREQKEKEVVRRRARDIQQLNWRYRQAARGQAETSNSILAKIVTGLTTVMAPVLSWFVRR